MKVGDLLRAAQALLDEPVDDTATTWPSGAAVLIRQAIEDTLDVFWARRAPPMQRATMKEQWLALPAYLGRDPVVGRAEYAWATLSEACHQRGYDVGLTEAELRELHATAVALAKRVATAITPGGQRTSPKMVAHQDTF